MSDGSPRGFEIRFFGIISILLACVILVYGTMFRYDPVVVDVLLIATIMLSIGLSFGFIMTGIRFKFFDMRIHLTLMWTGVVYLMVLYIQKEIPLTFDTLIAPISPRLLRVLVGVSEECFFRVFLCGVGSMFTKWGAIIGSSAIWSAYHINRYGGNTNILLVIFLVGLGLGWIYLHTRFADGVIFGHALVNYFSETRSLITSRNNA